MLCSSMCSILFWKMFLSSFYHLLGFQFDSHRILHWCSLTLNVRSHMQNANQLNYSWLPSILVEPLSFLLCSWNEPVSQRANKDRLFEKKWCTARTFNCFFFTTGLSFVCLVVFLFLFSGKWKGIFRTEESAFPLIACVQLWGRTGKKDDVMLRG